MCHVQSQPDAAGFARAVIFAAPEFLEQMLLVAAADTDAGVFDSERQFVFGGFFDRNRYAALLRVFDGVGDEVLQQFFQIQPAFVDVDRTTRL